MRKRRGSQNRCVLDANAVMNLVTLLQATQNRNRVFHGRFSDEHWLEAAFECRVFFNVFLVFVERGSANSAQLAAGELGRAPAAPPPPPPPPTPPSPSTPTSLTHNN